MKNNELVFYTNFSRKALFAARRTGSAIMFDESEQKWEYSRHNYYQLEIDCIYDGFDNLTLEEAKKMYKDIIPDEKLLDKLDELSGMIGN